MFNKLWEDMTEEEKEKQRKEWNRRLENDNWVPLKEYDDNSNEK